MADIIRPAKIMAVGDIRTFDFDFSNDLRTGETVSSATAVHIPPSGSAATPTVGTISANIVPVTLSLAGGVAGTHYLDCRATTSNSDKSTIRIIIEVPFTYAA